MIRSIPAITTHQPWASLIAFSVKTIETRSWSTRYRGPLAIHAGRLTREAFETCIDDPYRELLVAQRVRTIGDLPWGAVIARATLVDCQRMTSSWIDTLRSEDPQEHALGYYAVGRYAWVMRDAVLLETPIAAKGKQGLWPVEVTS